MLKLELGDFGQIRLTRDSEFVLHYNEDKTVTLPKGTELTVIAGSEGIIILDGEYTNCTRLYAKTICDRMKHCIYNDLYKEEVEKLNGKHNVILSTFKLVNKEEREKLDQLIEDIDNFYDVIA